MKIIKNNNIRRTFSEYFVKVRFKLFEHNNLFRYDSYYLIISIILWCLFQFNIKSVQCNRPPRFLIDGQTEIVLRLKEGADTPLGKKKPRTIYSSEMRKLKSD